MNCKRCGNELKEGELFCSKCGKSTNTNSKKKYIIIGLVIAFIILIATGVIVVPKIMNYIQEQKYQEEMKTDLDNINIQLKTQEIVLPYKKIYNEDLFKNEHNIDLENVDNYSQYEKLVTSYSGGTLDITGNININEIGQYEITYKIISEKGNTKTVVIVVKVQDMEKPKINVDNEIIEINKGTEVNILEGVIAEDNTDNSEELTSKIITEGTVDTNTIGEYTITYKVTDSADLSTERTRTYKVVEKKEVKIGNIYSHRIYNENYTNGYADSTVIFKNSNKIEYKEVDTMSIFDYKGTYTISNGIVTAKVEVNDFVDGYSSKTVKFRIQDQNTIVNTSNGYTYKTK